MMSTLSNRLGLFMPGDADIVDVNALNQNATKLDTYLNITAIPSLPFPPSGFEGQLLYRRDTKSLYRWNSNSSGAYKWVQFASSSPDAPGNTPTFSSMGGQSSPVSVSGTTNNTFSHTFSAVAGHRYAISITSTAGFFNIDGTYSTRNNLGICELGIIICRDVGSTATMNTKLDSTRVCGTVPNGSNGYTYMPFNLEVWYTEPTSQTVTYSVWMLGEQFSTPTTGNYPLIYCGVAGAPANTQMFNIVDQGQTNGGQP